MSIEGPIVKPVIIVGMGPAGLSAAIKAAQKGVPVIILENRDHFSRTQRLHADSRTFQFLDSLRDPSSNEDDHFFEHQCFRQKGKDGKPAADGVVQVKDVQAFLERKLAAYPNVAIKRGKGYDITGLDPRNQIVTMTKPGSTDVERIQFSHIIAADGGKRGITAKLNEAGEAAYQIKHTDLPLQHRQWEVGTAGMQLKAGENPPPNLSPEGSGSNFKFEHMKALNKLGWDQSYFPKVRVFRDEEGRKFFFSGEVPRTIQHIKDKESQRKALEQWAQLIVSIEMGIEPDKLELPQKAVAPTSDNPTQDEMKHARSVEKDNLRATAFKLQLSRADKPAVMLGQGGAFALVGDAYKSANFFYGHGMNDAIQDGLKAAECIVPGITPDFNFGQFESHQQAHTRMLDTRMRMDGETPTINLPAVFQRMEQEIKNLIKLAEKMNSPEVKRALEDLKQAAQPGTAEFDGLRFALLVEDLGKQMDKFAQGKLDANVKKGGGIMLNMHSDSAKFTKMQDEIKAAIEGVQKEIGSYYKFNNEQRQTWGMTLRSSSPPLKYPSG